MVVALKLLKETGHGHPDLSPEQGVTRLRSRAGVSCVQAYGGRVFMWAVRLWLCCWASGDTREIRALDWLGCSHSALEPGPLGSSSQSKGGEFTSMLERRGLSCTPCSSTTHSQCDHPQRRQPGVQCGVWTARASTTALLANLTPKASLQPGLGLETSESIQPHSCLICWIP